MKNILVVNVNWMGDVIFSVPVFKAIKEKYPHAWMSCLAVPRVKEIAECIPYMDRVIVYDEDGEHKSLSGKWKLIGRLKKEQFDAAFLLHGSLTRALLVYLAGIPIRVGYDTKRRGIFLTHKTPPLPGIVHRADHYLNVIEFFTGLKTETRSNILFTPKAAQDKIAALLSSLGIAADDFWVVIHPGANWDLKRWPYEYFTLLIQRLMEDHQAKVLISGGANDVGLVEKIIAPLKNKPLVLVGKTDLYELMALMHAAKLVISADSGPLHLANSVGAKVIALFGPTRPEITGPRGYADQFILQKDVGCNRAACYHLNCPDNICMQSLTVEDILRVVRQIKSS